MSLRDDIEARLGYWRDRGALEATPTPWQLKVGFVAMLPITLSESERERATSRRTWMGQVPVRVPLQVLYCPRQLLADTGLSQRADQIVRHVLSVFHEDAFLGYDLQLLASHAGGLARLAEEAERVARGRTRWAPFLTRLVGGAGYHAGLVTLAERAADGRFPDPLDLDPRFATLVGFARYCRSFPDWPPRSFYGFDLDAMRGRDR